MPRIRAWLGRFVAQLRVGAGRSAIPSVDYYFRAALTDLISPPGAAPSARKPIRQLSATLYEADGHLVVIRYVDEEALAYITSKPRRPVHYVIDDMLPIAAECLELPDDYRTRLAGYAETLLPRLLALRPAIIAPSPSILALFPNLACSHLDPCNVVPLRPGLPVCEWPGGRGLRLALLGTRSHRQSLGPLAHVAEGVRAALPQARLTHFMGAIGPHQLTANPIVEARRGLSWPDYRTLMTGEPFDIALTILPESRFNQGRSITKALECAAFGAAGLYSRRPPFADLISDGADGLLLPDAPEAWVEAIVALARDPARVRRLAAGGRDLAVRRGDPERVRRFWLDRLGIADPAPRA